MVTKNRSRENRYEIVSGLFTHELGHCLFTDFLSAQTYDNFLQRYKWYPNDPNLMLTADIRREQELWDYVKADSRNLEMLRLLSQHILQYIGRRIRRKPNAGPVSRKTQV